MDMNQVNVEAIVKQVLEGMLEKQAAPVAAPKAAGGAIPKTSRVAMLTKLENYETRFKEKVDEIETQKNDYISLYDGLEVKFNNLVAEYETNAKNKIKEINDNVLESKNILDKEQTTFSTFIADNKANFDKQYTEITTLVTKYNTTTTESLSNIEKREKTITSSQAKIEKIEADCQVIKDSITEYINNMNTKTKEIDEKTKKFTVAVLGCGSRGDYPRQSR